MVVNDCPFCEIAAGRAPATMVANGIQSIAIVPLNPVTPGHLLVIPRTHVADAYEDPAVTAASMRDAADWARLMSDSDPRYESVNLITSVGARPRSPCSTCTSTSCPARSTTGSRCPGTAADAARASGALREPRA